MAVVVVWPLTTFSVLPLDIVDGLTMYIGHDLGGHMSKHEITQDYLKSIFTYEDGQLVWAKKLSARINVGQPAGTRDRAGYIQIGLRGKIYRAHHLI